MDRLAPGWGGGEPISLDEAKRDPLRNVTLLAACGRDLFGNPVPANFPAGRHWARACGVPLLLLALLGRRVRGVEVVT